MGKSKTLEECDKRQNPRKPDAQKSRKLDKEISTDSTQTINSPTVKRRLARYPKLPKPAILIYKSWILSERF